MKNKTLSIVVFSICLVIISTISYIGLENQYALANSKCSPVSFSKDSAINIFFIPTYQASANDISQQKDKANSLIGELFQIKPYSLNKEKFNFYFLEVSPNFNNDVGSQTYLDYSGLRKIVEDTCNVSENKINQIVTFTNSSGGRAGYENKFGYGSVNLDLNVDGITLAHELAHTFGFSDEYAAPNGVRSAAGTPFAANLGTEGCPNWCSGKLDTSNQFYPIYEGWKNCVISKGLDLNPTTITVVPGGNLTDYNEKWNSCWNEWAEKYYNAANSAEFIKYCPYGGSNVITIGHLCSNPKEFENLNLGTSCITNTGCYFTAFGVNEWRQQENSIMRTETSNYDIGNVSFGTYSEKVLQNRIDELASSMENLITVKKACALGDTNCSIPPPNTINTTPIVYNFGNTTLKNGSKGEAVKELQRFLNANLKLNLVIDGKLGPKTILVIKQWQKNNGLVADGLIGAKTKEKMNSMVQ